MVPDLTCRKSKPIMQFSEYFRVIFGIIDFWMHPGSLVVRVINLLGLPLTLVLGIVDHGGLPLSVHFIIPILWFGGIGVRDMLGLLPVFSPRDRQSWHYQINPIFRLFLFGVLDLLGWEEVPVVCKTSTLGLLVINENLIGAIGVEDKGVEMGEDIILTSIVLFDEMVLPLVLENDMNLLGSRSTKVRSKHHIIGRISVHVGLFEVAVKELDISTSTVNVLFVFNCELDHQGLVNIGERAELG